MNNEQYENLIKEIRKAFREIQRNSRTSNLKIDHILNLLKERVLLIIKKELKEE